MQARSSFYHTALRWLREFFASHRQWLNEFLRQLYRSGLIIILVLMFVLIVAGALLVLAAENYSSSSQIKSITQAIWWAIVTMTTTGYGDLVPFTLSGRGAAILLMFGGITLVALFSATISSVFVVMRLREGRGLQKIHWTEHIVVCGWNSIAISLLEGLKRFSESKPRIVLINMLSGDEMQNVAERFRDLKLEFVHGDSTQEETLKRGNLSSAQTVILLSDNGISGDDRQIFVALAARSLNKNAKLYAQVTDEKNIYHLKRAGVDEVVWVAPYAGFLLATHAVAPGIPKVFDELLSPQQNISFIKVPIAKEWYERTYGEFANEYRKSTGGQIIGLLQETSLLSVGDILSHDISSIDEFIRRKFNEAGMTGSELEREQVRMNPPDETKLKKRDIAVALPPYQKRKEEG
ncbi:MAG: NAD-binding protein [bacterium]|nr:NAD-binding protein [bacterium]